MSDRVDLGPATAEVWPGTRDARVVLLPGARYGSQAPLLWFAREVALSLGASVVAVDPGPGGDPAASAAAALDLEPRLARQVVIGKSLASLAAGVVAEREHAAIWLTPLLRRPEVVEALAAGRAPTLLVGGTGDEWWQPGSLPSRPQLHVAELPGLDHSLQVPGDPDASLRALGEVVAIVTRFLGGEL